MRIAVLALIGACLVADTSAVRIFSRDVEDMEDSDNIPKEKAPEGKSSADLAKEHEAKAKMKAWREGREQGDLNLGKIDIPADAASRKFDETMMLNHIRDKHIAKAENDEKLRQSGKKVPKDYDGKKDEELSEGEKIDKLASETEQKHVAEGKDIGGPDKNKAAETEKAIKEEQERAKEDNKKKVEASDEQAKKDEAAAAAAKEEEKAAEEKK